MKCFFWYFAAISLLSVIVTIHDKSAAQKGKWRVRESTLFLLAALGGSAAMYLTMRMIHHKTKHKRFMIGLPLLFLLQLAVGIWGHFYI